jgi:hypothetical protein
MPAFVLVLRFGGWIVPLPWFLLWLVLLPFGILAWLTGVVASLFTDRWIFRALLQAPRALYVITTLSGMRCDITSSGRRFAAAWI